MEWKMTGKEEIGIDPKTGATVQAIFTDVPRPPRKEPALKVEEPQPHCWHRPYEIYISKGGMNGAMVYNAQPFAIVGTIEEADQISRERSEALGLPIYMTRGMNARLPRVPPDGVIVRQIEFDELDPHEIRCVRGASW
jgi:hypothetical protein